MAEEAHTISWSTVRSHMYLVRVLRLLDDQPVDVLGWFTFHPGTDETVYPVQFAVKVTGFHARQDTPDSEPVGMQDVAELEAAFEDVAHLTDGDLTYAPLLFVARKRHARPVAAGYPTDSRLWPLFDAAGPEQEDNL